MIQVGVVGYGTIGKRVADAVVAQRDMDVVGVAKTSPNFEAETAVSKGYDLYAAVDERRSLFDEAGVPVAGDLDDLVSAADVIVDVEGRFGFAHESSRAASHLLVSVLLRQ